MIDLASLLAPLDGPSPSGVDLSFSAEFDAIQEARRSDDPTLDQGEWVTDIKESDWTSVRQQCTQLLSHKSKDLRLAIWLTEALGKQNGFAALASGLRLTAGLCNQYWETVHPQAEQDDQEQRIGNLTWLLTRCKQLVRELPVTQSPDMFYSTLDHDSALQLSRLVAKNPTEAASLSEGRLSLDQFDKARRSTPKTFYQQTLAAVRDCHAALAELESAVDARLGLDGPGFTATKAAFGNVLDLVERCAREAGVLGQESSTAGTSTPTSVATMQTYTGALTSRAQALQQLHAVAEFFKQTEPHSPVAYLVEKAVRWGEMPLHDWLRTVVKDPASLSHLEEMLGVDSSSTAAADKPAG